MNARVNTIGAMLLLLGVPVAIAQPTPGQPGTVQDGTVQDGTGEGDTDGTVAADGTVQNGTVNGTVTADGTVPTDRNQVRGTTPALPSFLDTTDRRIQDDRPAPTAAQVAALREMEAEVARFTGSGGAYRNTVVSLVRREYLRQRRGRNQWYARQIREEERLLNEARERAIRQFEQFVRRYPDDPNYSPDAMFRLGELYYERSAVQFQVEYDAAVAAQDRGEEAEIPVTPDFMPTISLYRRLVANFTDYRRLDGVYYLIGYCLNEMGLAEEARDAWLALVCANHYDYDPEHHASVEELTADAEAGEDGEDGPEEHPALTLDPTEADPAVPGVFVDPYAQCQPVVEGAEFVSETWFRIGEYHFDDYGDVHSLELSIAAYRKILENPEDRNYNLALYKVAWAYYRASRYPEAINTFGMLVQWSDDEHERTGEAGSQLRPEAIQYLGIAFAYDDWNENGLPDTIDGMPDGITRVQDPQLLPQDRAWTAEVYFQLGQVYFDEAKYPEAVAVWELLLSRWPRHRTAPEVTNMIARAHQRNNEFDAAIADRARLAGYLPGSEWYDSNVENPTEQRRAEELAENALIATAIHEHEQAQRERRRSVEFANAGDAAQALAAFEQAKQHYGRAAVAYRQYLDRYPNNPQAYELQYNLADALYWSESYEDAAREYAAVRDSNLDDTHLSESARLVVESLKAIIDRAQENGSLTSREEAPTPSGTPPSVQAIEMPQLLQRMAQARELYMARVSEAQDSQHVRAAYDYNNALLLYWYGYWPQAKERFERIFEERCAGPHANNTGLVAWESLRTMAVAVNDTEEIRRLASALNERQCTFSPTGEACPPRGPQLDTFCAADGRAEHRCCLAINDLLAIEFQDALGVFEQAQGTPAGPEQTRLFERSATMLIEAVNESPNHPQAPIALEQAAVALEQTQRFDSARQIYQRIIDEVGPRTNDEPEEQLSLDRIVANAYFKVAFNANRGFDFETAVTNYRVLVDSPRFARSTDPNLVERRRDALVNTAVIFERLQRYDDATRYYRQILASNDSDAELKRTAMYRIAEIAYNRENWNLAIREMRAFIQRYERDAAAGELVVQAYWRISQARKEMRQTRDYNRSLQDVVTAFGRTGQQPRSIAAEYAANAQFLLTNETMSEFEDFAITPGRPATLEAYVNTVRQQITAGGQTATRFAEGFNSVMTYQRPTWTVAAFVQQGRVYEVLARAVLNTPFAMPADLNRQLSRVSRDAREDIRIQVQDRIQQVLDEMVRPIECLAVARYALASRAARAGSLDNEWTQSAIDRLQAYGDERIAECVAQAQAADSTFQAYQPGEFARAPRGQHLQIEADITPPALAR